MATAAPHRAISLSQQRCSTYPSYQRRCDAACRTDESAQQCRRDASPQAIEIRADWDTANFMLKIRDQGAGLSEEAALKAGSAFFTTKTEGRGLGLLLANATIERMGGTVRLFNREEGGATTVLTLPIAKAGT